MADKKISIDYNFQGLTKALGTQQQLNKELSKGEDIVKKSNTGIGEQFLLLENNKRALEIALFNQRGNEAATQRLTQQLSDVNNQLEPMKGAFDQIISATPLKRLFDMRQKMEGFNDAVTKLGGTQGVASILEAQFSSATQIAGNFSKNIKGIFKGGIGGALTSLQPILATLSAGFTSLAVAAGPILLVVGAIAAAVFVLSRVWKNNIGGIQTSFFKVIGQLQDIWGQFITQFDKSLRKFEPFFKILTTVLFVPLIGALKILGAILKGVFTILNPILDALNEIGTALMDAFGIVGGQGNTVMKIFEGLAKAIGFVAKGIAFVIKIALAPLMFTLKQVEKSIKFIQNVKDKLTGNAGDAKNMPSTVGAVQASQISNSRSSTVNNNPNVTINSMAPISEQSAPRIGDLLAKSVAFDSKTI